MKRSQFIYMVILNVLVIVFGIMTLYYMNAYSRERTKIRTGIKTWDTSFKFSQFYHKMNDYLQRQDAFFSDNLLVIGDSHVQGLAVNHISSDAVNLGIAGDTIFGVLHRASMYQAIKRARGIVLEAGVNDIKYFTDETILENFSSFFQLVPSTIPVYVNSIIPVQNIMGVVDIDNDRIRMLNQKLSRLCETFPNCRFVNMMPLLSDMSGNLRTELCLKDGIHLNDRGNRIWLDELRRIISR